MIHSLPWLSAATRNLGMKLPPSGEIDFLVLHPVYGVLALEVKSGIYRVEGTVFGKRKLTAVCSHQTRIGNLDAHLI
ncbi:nuclease-related domain-containing protein [Escherichia coli]